MLLSKVYHLVLHLGLTTNYVILYPVTVPTTERKESQRIRSETQRKIEGRKVGLHLNMILIYIVHKLIMNKIIHVEIYII